MKCREVERLLSEDLRNLEDAEIQSHLGECPQCSRLAEEFRELDSLRHSLNQGVQAPAGFHQAVHRRVSRGSHSLFVYALSCLLLVILGATLAWKSSGTASSSELGIRTSDLADWQHQGFSEAGASAQDAGVPNRLSDKGQYVEVMITDSNGETYIVKIPSQLQVRQVSGESDGYYMTTVSH